MSERSWLRLRSRGSTTTRWTALPEMGLQITVSLSLSGNQSLVLQSLV
jgi:hypothetical protein